MNQIERLSAYTALHVICRGTSSLDHDPEAALRERGVKRIQFEAYPEMVADLDSICNLLNVSKRKFLEAAVIDAIKTAEQKFHDVFLEATGEEFPGQQFPV